MLGKWRNVELRGRANSTHSCSSSRYLSAGLPFRRILIEKQGDDTWPMQRMSSAKLKKVLAALEEQLASRDGGLPHLSGPGRARHRPGARPGAAPSGQQPSGSTPTLWQAASSNWADPSRSTRGKPGGEADSLANRAGGVRMALRRLEIEESRAHRQLRRAAQGSGRRGLHRHPRSRHRGREGSLPRARFAAARPLYRLRPARPRSTPRRFSKRCWPSATRAASSPAHGSATPSTASTTGWAPSSASSPASPARPPATANMCCWPASPA